MRNYKKEIEWRKNRYCLVRGYINKEIGEKLKKKLKNEKKSIAGWIEENARKEVSKYV